VSSAFSSCTDLAAASVVSGRPSPGPSDGCMCKPMRIFAGIGGRILGADSYG
jgi:hypothetical protein